MSVSLLLVALPADRAAAVLQGCTVNASPATVMVNNDQSFSFSITNTSTSSVEWVDISAPGGGYFTVEAGSANHWTTNVTSGDVSFTNWALTPGRSQTFTVRAFPNAPSGSLSWNVQASDDPGGASAIACSGNTGVVITGPPIQITNVQATNITNNSATITWNTNDPGTSQVNYGLDSSYGQSTPEDSTLVTSHSMTLSGLSADTAYHFQAVSNAAANSSTDSSSDDTFMTTITPSSGSGGGGGNTTPLPTHNGVPILSKPIEASPPTVAITTPPPAVGKTEPTVSGTADDAIAVARVEFSTDGGVNWLPVQQANGLGTANVTWSFQPIHLQDGSYKLVVRATNTSGLTASTSVVTFAVDRITPAMGAAVFALGPQIMQPDQSGIITTMTGVDQSVTVSSVGGDDQVSITATNQSDAKQSQVFSLTKIDDSWLWSGVMSFANPGTYQLVSRGEDGAGVVTTRTLNLFNVLPAAKTADARSARPVPATVKIYYYDTDSASWVLWDGQSYGQANPVQTKANGTFGLFLPAGKYYLAASAPGYHGLVSSIFSVAQPTPVSTILKMSKYRQLNLGPLHLHFNLPSFHDQSINVNYAPSRTTAKGQGSFVGQPAPDFAASDTAGNTIHAASLLGKPTLLTFGATWAPTTVEELSSLSRLQTNPSYNIEPVAVQQPADVTQAFTTIAGLKLDWLVDPNGDLANMYSVRSLPTNYFIDRNGIVRHVTYGVLGQQQITDELNSL